MIKVDSRECITCNLLPFHDIDSLQDHLLLFSALIYLLRSLHPHPGSLLTTAVLQQHHEVFESAWLPIHKNILLTQQKEIN